MKSLYTKDGKPFHKSPDGIVYSKSGKFFGKFYGDKIFDKNGKYVGTMVCGRLVSLQDHKKTTGPRISSVTNIAGISVNNVAGVAISGDEPDIPD